MVMPQTYLFWMGGRFIFVDFMVSDEQGARWRRELRTSFYGQ